MLHGGNGCSYAAFDSIRFQPYLRNACKRFVTEHRAGENRAPIISDDSPNKDINIAFYNIPMLKRYVLAPPEVPVMCWATEQFVLMACGSLRMCGTYQRHAVAG